MDSGERKGSSAYGGPGWQPRNRALADELGSVWGNCGVTNEWGTLKSVLLHRPGAEIDDIGDADRVQFLALPDPARARLQHDLLGRTLVDSGVDVHYLAPKTPPPPNQMFAADLFFMTREGAILGRPASLVRAGEEVHVAQKLLDLQIPILASVNGSGTFEGADAAWLDAKTVLIGIGKRTNEHGLRQVTDALAWLGVEAVPVRLPGWAMHLMGILRFTSPSIAVAWPGSLPEEAAGVLKRYGYRLAYIPDEAEAVEGHALNFVTLGALRILAPAGNRRTIAFYRDLGLECIEVEVSELIKAAGAIGCLTGILERSAV